MNHKRVLDKLLEGKKLNVDDRLYIGLRDKHGSGYVYVVASDGEQHLLNYKEKLYGGATPFNWGYQGGGPKQLAESLLRDVLPDKHWLAHMLTAGFMKEVIKDIPENSWQLTNYEILDWINRTPHEDKPPKYLIENDLENGEY